FIVVYFFLGNFRSTFITGMALPNSLIGSFILMYMMGFTINIITLLAMSLAVGLLIDDAIVVRENIWRHMELGKSPKEAAIVGTSEVLLAVFATSLTVISVFLPVGFLQGTVGQFFKQLGWTVVFAMTISLFDAVTMAPLLSAYLAKRSKVSPHASKKGPQQEDKPFFLLVPLHAAAKKFSLFQDWLTGRYERVIRASLRHRVWVIVAGIVIFFVSLFGLGPHIK